MKKLLLLSALIMGLFVSGAVAQLNMTEQEKQEGKEAFAIEMEDASPEYAEKVLMQWYRQINDLYTKLKATNNREQRRILAADIDFLLDAVYPCVVKTKSKSRMKGWKALRKQLNEVIEQL